MRRRCSKLTGVSTAWVMPLAAVAIAWAAGESLAQGPDTVGGMPFANIYRRPALSPYTALGFQGGNPMTGATLGALQSGVQPQMQQQAQIQASLRQSRQLGQMQGQMRQLQRPGSATTQTIRATGHASQFMELSHFYPAAR